MWCFRWTLKSGVDPTRLTCQPSNNLPVLKSGAAPSNSTTTNSRVIILYWSVLYFILFLSRSIITNTEDRKFENMYDGLKLRRVLCRLLTIEAIALQLGIEKVVIKVMNWWLSGRRARGSVSESLLNSKNIQRIVILCSDHKPIINLVCALYNSR